VLLKHLFKDSQQSEYIMVDRQDPTKSTNLTTTLGTNPTEIALRNKAYDQYYLYDQASSTLSTADLKNPTPQIYLHHVLAFKAYGSNQVLYATDQDAPAGTRILSIPSKASRTSHWCRCKSSRQVVSAM